MKALDRKLLRELGHLRSQVVAIVLVVACGIVGNVSMRAAHGSLLRSRDRFYDAYRFADVWARAVRVPEAVAARISEIPGVSTVEPRIVDDVSVDVPGFGEPVLGRLISLPDGGRPRLDDVYLRSGRFVEPGRRDEVLVSEAFAQAHHLAPGDSLTLRIGGRQQRVRLVGIALSPAYVFSAGGGTIWPDNLRFGVLWMAEDALASALDLTGAFNDVALRLAPGANRAEVIDRVDELLAPYGSGGAVGRDMQVSARFLEEELGQLRLQSVMFPVIFLAVAAFLLNLVLARLIAAQRQEVAVLKAMGYGDLTIGLHFAKLAGLIVALGAGVGLLAGVWLGRMFLDLYAEFYRFPVLRLGFDGRVLTEAIGSALAGGLLGSWFAVRGVVKLPPAEAMRPPAPASFGRGLLERAGVPKLLPQGGRIVLRNLERRPLNTALSVLGIALALTTLLPTILFQQAFLWMMEIGFFHAQRQDMTVAFTRPMPDRAIHELAAIPGVLYVEPVRTAAVRLRHGPLHRDVPLMGVRADSELQRLVDGDLSTTPLPTAGLALTRALAERLQLGIGDEVEVEVLEGERRKHRALVASFSDEMLGLAAHADIAEVNRLLGEGPLASGAMLLVDEARRLEVYRSISELPGVATAELRLAGYRSFQEQSGASMLVSIGILMVFSSIIAVGVLYNSARIALSERSRELASLRVLGFTIAEISRIYLGELLALIALALPLGLLLGQLVAVGLASVFENEFYRFPLIPRLDAYVISALAILVAGVVTALLVRRRLDHLDLVAVLKSRE